MPDSLGDRMKEYEDVSRLHLPRRMPLIIRLDGKAFHTYTRGLQRPYDAKLMEAMNEVTTYLCKSVQNCVMAYTQSDEISLLLVDYFDIKTDSWFSSNLQKMVSVVSGMASGKLTELSNQLFGLTRMAIFDARAFVLPTHEVSNYFIWRQQNWTRNSIQMLAQSLYSHKQLHGKNNSEMHEMCFQKGRNWANESSHIKNGRIVLKRTVERQRQDGTVHWNGPEIVLRKEWYIPEETPIFKDNRQLIQDLITPSLLPELAEDHLAEG